MADTAATTPTVAELLARARVYVESSHARQTLEAYAADWTHVTTWCDEHKRRSLPMEDVQVTREGLIVTLRRSETDFAAASGRPRVVMRTSPKRQMRPASSSRATPN